MADHACLHDALRPALSDSEEHAALPFLALREISHCRESQHRRAASATAEPSSTATPLHRTPFSCIKVDRPCLWESVSIACRNSDTKRQSRYYRSIGTSRPSSPTNDERTRNNDRSQNSFLNERRSRSGRTSPLGSLVR